MACLSQNRPFPIRCRNLTEPIKWVSSSIREAGTLSILKKPTSSGFSLGWRQGRKIICKNVAGQWHLITMTLSVRRQKKTLTYNMMATREKPKMWACSGSHHSPLVRKYFGVMTGLEMPFGSPAKTSNQQNPGGSGNCCIARQI